MKKKLLALALIVVTVLTAAIPAFAAAAAIKKTEYEDSGYVEVDFKRDVQYKNLKVSVKDSTGKSYSVSIKEKDEDDLTFRVNGIKSGMGYTYTIFGVRAGRSGSYGKVSGKFSVPAAQVLSIKKVEYDFDDRELEIDFNGRVQYKSVKVVVKDSTGKTYTTRILEKDKDSIEARVRGLKWGETYTVTVSGVRASGAGSYESVSKTFAACDD